jgi:hypothetical protein
MKRHVTVLAAGAATAAAVGLATVALTGPAAAAAGSTEHFRIYSANRNDRDLPQVFAAHGPIHGVGLATPDDDVPGDTIPIVVTMRGGGKIYLKAHGPFTWHPNLKTCTATEHDTGTFRITGGTGRYRTARGSGSYSEAGAGLGKRNAKGNCEESFAINYVIVNATGTVHL